MKKKILVIGGAGHIGENTQRIRLELYFGYYGLY
jgi:hypothetical protein